MNYITKAVQLAIEKGGYKDGEHWYKDTNSFKESNIKYLGEQSSTFLDPLFWSSLGKALGWHMNADMQAQWLYHWHRFIDHLADGKNTDDFFKDLLNERKDLLNERNH